MKSDWERIVELFESRSKCVHKKKPKVVSDYGWIGVECEACCRLTDGEGHSLSYVLAQWENKFGSK